MLVYGGIDEYGNILSDIYILEFSPTLTWFKVDIKSKPSALAHHCSALVLSAEKKNHPSFDIYRYPDLPQSRVSTSKIQVEGLYVFGGMDNERKYRNDLKVLRLGKRPLDFVHLKTTGTPPSPRVNATLNFYEELHLLILFGGKNETHSKLFYNDLHVFDLETCSWSKVTIFDKIPVERGEHSTVIYGNKMYIYGGINMDKYLGSEFYIINLDIWEKKRKKYKSNQMDLNGNENSKFFK